MNSKKNDLAEKSRGGKSPGAPKKPGPEDPLINAIRGKKLRLLRKKLIDRSGLEWKNLLKNEKWSELISPSQGRINKLERGIDKFHDGLKDNVVEFFGIPKEFMDDDFCVNGSGVFSEECFKTKINEHDEIFDYVVKNITTPINLQKAGPFSTLDQIYHISKNINVIVGTHTQKIEQVINLISDQDNINLLIPISKNVEKILNKTNNACIDDIKLDISAHSNSLNLEFCKGNLNNSFKHIDKIIKLDPNNLDYYIAKGGLCYSLGKVEEALELFNYILSKDCYNCAALSSKAIILLYLGNIEEANSICDYISKAHNNSVYYFLLMSNIMLHNKNYESASVYIEKAIDINNTTHEISNVIDLYFDLITIYIKISNIDRALLYIEKAIILAPSEMKYLFYLLKLSIKNSTGEFNINDPDYILFNQAVQDSPTAKVGYMTSEYLLSENPPEVEKKY